MAPSTSKASYKTYEAQARLVRAIVAAHPGVKWDYKEIAACYGSDMTKDALNHRFRHLKAEALIIEEGRKRGFDMRNLACDGGLPGTKNAVDVNEIAKYFGQSTPDGIQFQFRSIKKDAEKLRQTEADGGDVASALSAELHVGGGTVTPGTVTPSKPTPRRRGPVSGSTKKRSVQEDVDAIKLEGSDDDFDGLLATTDVDQTPSKRPKFEGARPVQQPPKRSESAAASLAVRPSATPSRSGRAASSFPDASQSPIDLESPASSAPPAPPKRPVSIFGPVSPKTHRSNGGSSDGMSSAFKSSGVDAYVGSQDVSTSMYTDPSFSYNDGEI